MPLLEPLNPEDLPEFAHVFEAVERSMGFVPASLRTLARVPELMQAFGGLMRTVEGLGYIDPGLHQMIANIASVAGGCRYCQAHTANHAAHLGVDPAKLEELWTFEVSDLFSEAERVALRFALAGSSVPNAVTEQHHAELHEHYTDEQIIEIVATMSAFGWLNRWNDSMGTILEDEPAAFAEKHLGEAGWEIGKHAKPGSE